VDHDGWQSLTKKELKRRGGTLRARINDQRRRINAAFSTRKRNAEGRVIGTRVDLFVHKPWDELEELIAEGVAQQATLDANVIVQKRALALRDRCPAARTAAEAAEMLELDLEAYLADEATS
jgi:hypothetical protein